MFSNSKTKGFTLIELMIVIAIIGILASIALPAYQDYIIRAQMAEAITMTNAMKPKVDEFYRVKGRFPRDNAEAGLAPAEKFIGNYVKRMSISNGAIHVVLGNKINALLNDKTLTIRPQYVDGNMDAPLAWLCGNDQVVEGMSVAGDNKTDIEAKFLPTACR